MNRIDTLSPAAKAVIEFAGRRAGMSGVKEYCRVAESQEFAAYIRKAGPDFTEEALEEARAALKAPSSYVKDFVECCRIEAFQRFRDTELLEKAGEVVANAASKNAFIHDDQLFAEIVRNYNFGHLYICIAFDSGFAIFDPFPNGSALRLDLCGEHVDAFRRYAKAF